MEPSQQAILLHTNSEQGHTSRPGFEFGALADPALAPFAAHVQSLAEQFESRAILTLVEQSLQR